MDGTLPKARINLANGKDFNDGVVAVGDLDGDGRADLTWRNGRTGGNHLWLMNGSSTSSSPSTNSLGADWTLITQGSPIYAVPDLNWTIQGIGDVDGDGQEDLFWRHLGNGQDVLWFMDGPAIPGYASIYQVTDLNWGVIGCDDFNGDGSADLVWSTGQVVLWTMNGSTILQSTLLDDLRQNPWSLDGLGDFDGDGKADLLWKHSHTRERSLWLMDGPMPTEQTSIY